VCRDEELFREQLTRYAQLVDGRPQLTPSQVRPLVSQHLPWLKPAARNKMYNAELVEIRSPGEWVEPTAYPDAAVDLKRNAEIWKPVLAALNEDPVPVVYLPNDDRGTYVSYTAKTHVIPHAQLLDIFESLTWGRPDLFAPHLEYLRDPSDNGCGTDDWAVILPQTSGRTATAGRILGSQSLSLVRRSRNAHGVFNRISGMAHRQSAERIAGALALAPDDPFATQFHQPRRGALLLYPVLESHPDATSQPMPISVNTAKLVLAAAFVPAVHRMGTARPYVRFRAGDSSVAAFSAPTS
jgi:hypothetical protein